MFHHVGDASPNAQEWRTRNVLAAIRGNTATKWAKLVDGSASGMNVKMLGRSLVGAFGADAKLHRVGVGRSRTRGNGTVSDTYYRNLRLNGIRRSKLPTEGGSASGGDSGSADAPDSAGNSVSDSAASGGNANSDSASGGQSVSASGGRTRISGQVSYSDDRFAFSGNLVEVDVPSEVQLTVRRR